MPALIFIIVLVIVALCAGLAHQSIKLDDARDTIKTLENDVKWEHGISVINAALAESTAEKLYALQRKCADECPRLLVENDAHGTCTCVTTSCSGPQPSSYCV